MSIIKFHRITFNIKFNRIFLLLIIIYYIGSLCTFYTAEELSEHTDNKTKTSINKQQILLLNNKNKEKKIREEEQRRVMRETITFLMAPSLFLIGVIWIYWKYKKNDDYNNEFYTLIEQKESTLNSTTEEKEKAKLLTDIAKAALYFQYKTQQQLVSQHQIAERMQEIIESFTDNSKSNNNSHNSDMWAPMVHLKKQQSFQHFWNIQDINKDIGEEIKELTMIMFYSWNLIPGYDGDFQNYWDAILNTLNDDKSYLDILAISPHVRFKQANGKTYGYFSKSDELNITEEFLALKSLLLLTCRQAIEILKTKADVPDCIQALGEDLYSEEYKNIVSDNLLVQCLSLLPKMVSDGLNQAKDVKNHQPAYDDPY
jgi:hypothetical protein